MVSNYCVRPRAACFKIFPVPFGFPEFHSTASLDVLVKLYLVVTKLGFIPVCISENRKLSQPKRIQLTEVSDVKDR